MTPFARLWRNAVQRLAGVLYEGPEPPPRYASASADFANAGGATAAEWAAFAKGLAEEAYRQGYVRGLEATERDHRFALPRDVPDVREVVVRDDGAVFTVVNGEEVPGNGEPASAEEAARRRMAEAREAWFRANAGVGSR